MKIQSRRDVTRHLAAAFALAFSFSLVTSEAAVYPPVPTAAFVCDRPDERLWSSELNGQPMPSTIDVVLNSANTALDAGSAVSAYRQVRVQQGTTLAALNAALREPNNSRDEVREFYFDAENYNFGGTILVTQPVKLIGTNTDSAGTSQSGQRTRIMGGNQPDLYAAIQGQGGNANNVEIRYLTVERFGRIPENPVVNLPDAKYAVDSQNHYGWIIRNNRIVDNAVAGLRAGSRAEVRNNCFETNGRYGISELDAFDLEVIQNEFVRNGIALEGTDQEDRGNFGAMKIFSSRSVNMRENWVHDNYGRGIWFDTNNSDVLIERNTAERNRGQGIMYETSYNARIHNNTVVDNNVTARTSYSNQNNPHCANPENPALAPSEPSCCDPRTPTPEPDDPICYYPGTPTDTGIFISNSGGADLVGGLFAQPVEGQLTDNRLRVSNNYVRGNKYGITVFQNAKRFCGSFDESSRRWCTLTGGRREAQSSRYIQFGDVGDDGIPAPMLITPWNSTAYLSCIPSQPEAQDVPDPDYLLRACFWNSTSVIVANNEMIVNPDLTQQSLIFQQATDACVYPSDSCNFRTQLRSNPDDIEEHGLLTNPFSNHPSTRNTFFRDAMIDSNAVTGTRWINDEGAATAPPPCPANVQNSATHGAGSSQYCSAWF